MKNVYSLVVGLALLTLISGCDEDTQVPSPVIISFNPPKGAFGLMVTIKGSGFGGVPDTAQVFFNGSKARVHYVNDTILYVFVPATATTGFIKVVIADGREAITEEEFEILKGSWTRKADLPADGFPAGLDRTGRVYVPAFVIGNKAYAGAGVTPSINGGPFGILKDWYEYDPSQDTWTRKADVPHEFGIHDAVSFAIGDKGYLGVGRTSHSPGPGEVSKICSREFWEYSPADDQWSRKADFPDTLRIGASGFGLGGKGYVGLGFLCNQGYLPPYRWWEYDPITDKWTQKANFPGPLLEDANGLVVNNKIFVGIGTPLPMRQAWFEYDATSDHWTRKGDYPGSLGFSHGDFKVAGKGYVMGHQGCWEYDPEADHWQPVAFLPTPNLGWDYGTTFSIGTHGYFLCGTTIEGVKNHLYEFTPGQ